MKFLNKDKKKFFDFGPLKDREQFLKVFKELEVKLNDERLNYQLKTSGKDPRQHFVEVDGEKVSYFDLQRELIRETFYFEFKHEIPYFVESFTPTPFFFVDAKNNFSKMEKMPILSDSDILEKSKSPSNGSIVKILEFATPEVSICDYKAYCNYVKKEIGLYDFEQIPRIKAVLDKRKELIREWSMKLREYASKYFDLSNVIEVEDYELQLLLASRCNFDSLHDRNYHFKGDLFHKFKLFGLYDLSNFPYIEELDYKMNIDRYGYFLDEHLNPTIILKQALEKDPNGPLAFSEADNKIYLTLVDKFAFHTLGYNADSHLFRRFLIKFPAKLIAHYIVKEIIMENLDFFIGKTDFKPGFLGLDLSLFLRFLDLNCERSYSENRLLFSLSEQIAFYINEILENTRLVKVWEIYKYYSSIKFELKGNDKFEFCFSLGLVAGKYGSFRELFNYIVEDEEHGIFKDQGTWYYKYKENNSICWKGDYYGYDYPSLVGKNFVRNFSKYLLNLEHYYLIHNCKFGEMNSGLYVYYNNCLYYGLMEYLVSIESYLKEEQTDILYVPVRDFVLCEPHPTYLVDLQLRENFFKESASETQEEIRPLKEIWLCPMTGRFYRTDLDLLVLHELAISVDTITEAYKIYLD